MPAAWVLLSRSKKYKMIHVCMAYDSRLKYQKLNINVSQARPVRIAS